MQAELFTPATAADGRTRVFNVRRVPSRGATDVYVGRAGQGEEGPWGNPYARAAHPEEALKLYLRFLASNWMSRASNFRERALDSCAGRRLLCFCLAGEWHTGLDWRITCHGQILAIAIDLDRGLLCPGLRQLRNLHTGVLPW